MCIISGFSPDCPNRTSLLRWSCTQSKLRVDCRSLRIWVNIRLKVQGKPRKYKLFYKDIYFMCFFPVMMSSLSRPLWDLQKPYAVHFIESSYMHEGYDSNDSWINDISLYLRYIKKKTF